MKHIYKIIYLILICSNLYGCKWCEKWKPLEEPKKGLVEPAPKEDLVDNTTTNTEQSPPDISQLSLEELVAGLGVDGESGFGEIPGFENLFMGIDNPKGKEVVHNYDEEEVSEVGKIYYKQYLGKYYPRALVITDHFYDMCPLAVQAGLDEVVDIVTNEPWFYFQNKPKNFKLEEYWEIVLGQYKTLSKFLSKAMVNKKDNTIYPRNDYDFGFNFDKSAVSLTMFWTECGVDSFYNFHAHHCDYLVKMFNEGIQRRDCKQSRKYSNLLTSAVRNLKNSRYESEYQEELKRSKWLLSALRDEESVEERY